MIKAISSNEALQKLQKLAASRGLQVQYQDANGREMPIRILNSSKKIVATGSLRMSGKGISTQDLAQTMTELKSLNSSKRPAKSTPSGSR